MLDENFSDDKKPQTAATVYTASFAVAEMEIQSKPSSPLKTGANSSITKTALLDLDDDAFFHKMGYPNTWNRSNSKELDQSDSLV